MKRLISFILAMTMLVGCGSTTEVEVPDENNTSTVQEANEPEEAPKKEDAEEEQPAAPKEFNPEEQTDDLAAMFMHIGFTEDEAKEMEEIFDVLGIREGRNIRLLLGSGIDEMQTFAFDPYNSKNLQVNCTVENRELCLVWLAGLAGYRPVFKVNFFGKIKVKEERTKESVDMFNRWVDDTDYHQPIEDSYLVTIDWENMELTEYKEGAIE